MEIAIIIIAIALAPVALVVAYNALLASLLAGGFAVVGVCKALSVPFKALSRAKAWVVSLDKVVTKTGLTRSDLVYLFTLAFTIAGALASFLLTA